MKSTIPLPAGIVGLQKLAFFFCILSVGLMFGSRALFAGTRASDAGFITVQAHRVTPHLSAYAQVEPISVLPVRIAEAGVVTGLTVVPGMHVRAGQWLARLAGPAISALLLQSQAELRSAQAQLSASQKFLAIQRQQLPSHLSTLQTVQNAASALAQAQSKFDDAQSRLASVRQMMTVSAPADGIVLKLNSTNGELVRAGGSILTLQPNHRLWLKAAYYGTDLSAIRVGMTGQFAPADRSGSIPVKVSAISGSLAPSGGESIAMVATESKLQWLNGEFGTVTLNSPQRMLVAVPTRALILDHGKWWVMVHTAQGDHPQAVVPGPARGWDTFIEQGLPPGTTVVVGNAYLLFHASISQHYQLPD